MSTAEFSLHPQLANDCIVIGHFKLCQVLLMNDVQYPWFILVPQREGIQEIYQLSTDDQQQLWQESAIFAAAIQHLFNADKLNIAALGNMVPQLHLHHIVRYKSDVAWPKPIWGFKPAKSYDEQEISNIVTKLQSAAIEGLSLKA